MKIKSLKKVIASFMCATLVLVSAPQMRAFAEPNQMPFRCGGNYSSLLHQKYDHKKYECHHLISRRALNRWAKYILKKNGLNLSNEFLLGDIDNQSWAPSIIMEKADHEKTLSYCNNRTRTHEQNTKAINYISTQASRIIQDGDIMGVLMDEINFIKKNLNSNHKYDRAISQVREYIRSLEFRHPDNTTLTMRNPDRSKKGPFKFSFKKHNYR